ncbi:MAG: hypothetical protein JW749_07100, partial [Sedimentisphaerales bacterium]|nr:hypothetical protein [Sedimentisphaerales bacterium]
LHVINRRYGIPLPFALLYYRESATFSTAPQLPFFQSIIKTKPRVPILPALAVFFVRRSSNPQSDTLRAPLREIKSAIENRQSKIF